MNSSAIFRKEETHLFSYFFVKSNLAYLSDKKWNVIQSMKKKEQETAEWWEHAQTQLCHLHNKVAYDFSVVFCFAVGISLASYS